MSTQRQSTRSAGWFMAIGAAVLIAFPVFAYAQGGPDHGQRRKRMADKAPAVGDSAPNFKLKERDGKGEVELSSFRGKKPVVLVFGSYT